MVCIEGGPWRGNEAGWLTPAKNEICAISNMKYVEEYKNIFLWLDGYSDGQYFLEDCFRPLVSTSTEQSRHVIIEKLLADALNLPVPVEV